MATDIDRKEQMQVGEVEDWTQLLNEYDYQRPERGQLRTGMVMRIDENQVLVDIGTKHEGVIPANDLRRLPPEVVEGLQVGDEIQVYVMEPESREGELVLSLNMVQVERDWQEAERLLESGEIVEAKVIGYNKGGLLVQFGRVRGFVPASQIVNLHSRTGAEGQQSAMTRMVNQSIPLKVIEVDRERNRLVLSERAAMQRWRQSQKERLLAELNPGDVVTGRVNQLTPFGAFIDLGGADGLAHISELSWQRVNHPREVLQPGQEVQVYVLEVDRERERIGLSLRRLQPDPWETIDQRYNLGQIVEGVVTNVAPFGVFVRVEEGVEGLIHASELASEGGQPEVTLQPGQTVLVKVISLDRQRQRLGLSLRRVSDEERETFGEGQGKEDEPTSEDE
ncbi:MAG: 30S ribosomal protein S1 [Herpetosiphonaceae bacterium]|nr:MAG: 30S ribosomal protein S1 [Herpetosiphonaceae bacterium]